MVELLSQEDLKTLVGVLNRDYGHALKKFQTYKFQDFDRKIVYKPLKTIDDERTPYYEVFIDGTHKGLVYRGYKVVLVEELIRLAGLQDKVERIEKLDRITQVFCPLKEITLDIIPYELIAGSSIVPNIEKLNGKDVIKTGIWIRTGYAGDYATRIAIGSYRVICKNGAIAFDEALSFRYTHRTFIPMKIIERLYEMIEKIEEKIKKLLTPFKDEDLEKLEKMWEKSKLSESDFELLERELERIDKARNGEVLKWDVFNVITALATHKAQTGKYEKLQKIANSLALV